MIQCFVKNIGESSFENNQFPNLEYVCKTDEKHNEVPRMVHLHENMVEIVLIREGQGTHIIGNKEYKIKKGDLLVYNKNVLHDENSNTETHITTYACGISNLHLKGLDENQLLPDNMEPVINTGDYFSALENIFEIMYSEIFSNKQGSEETSAYLLLSLVSMASKLINSSGNTKERDEYELGQTIKKYIDDHFLENLSVKSLSEKLGISQYYLIRIFKKKTGYSPMQYIIKRKIGLAQNLLINTDLSVVQISEKLGYDNPNYFNVLFTKTIGLPPGKYRKYITYRKTPD